MRERSLRIAVVFAGGLAACGADPPAATCGAVTLESPLIVLTRDRDTSGVARVSTAGCVDEIASLEIGADPALSVRGARPFVLARDLGVVLEVDPETLALAPPLAVFSTAAGGDPLPAGCDEPSRCHNPHDLDVAADGSLWVTRYDLDSLAILRSPAASATSPQLESVSLAAFADGDGRPEMEGIAIFEDRAFVSLEFLDFLRDGTPPTRTGALAVIDLATREIDGALVDLGGNNPFGRLAPVPGSGGAVVAVALLGDPDAIDEGGLEGVVIVDLPKREVRPAVSEAALGGSAFEAVVVSEREGYAIVGGPERGLNPTRVARFDPSTGQVTRVLVDSRDDEPGFYHAGLAVSAELVAVGDRTPGHARVRFFRRDDGAAAGELALSLYPAVALGFIAAR